MTYRIGSGHTRRQSKSGHTMRQSTPEHTVPQDQPNPITPVDLPCQVDPLHFQTTRLTLPIQTTIRTEPHARRRARSGRAPTRPDDNPCRTHARRQAMTTQIMPCDSPHHPRPIHPKRQIRSGHPTRRSCPTRSRPLDNTRRITPNHTNIFCGTLETPCVLIPLSRLLVTREVGQNGSSPEKHAGTVGPVHTSTARTKEETPGQPPSQRWINCLRQAGTAICCLACDGLGSGGYQLRAWSGSLVVTRAKPDSACSRTLTDRYEAFFT